MIDVSGVGRYYLTGGRLQSSQAPRGITEAADGPNLTAPTGATRAFVGAAATEMRDVVLAKEKAIRVALESGRSRKKGVGAKWDHSELSAAALHAVQDLPFAQPRGTRRRPRLLNGETPRILKVTSRNECPQEKSYAFDGS